MQEDAAEPTGLEMARDTKLKRTCFGGGFTIYCSWNFMSYRIGGRKERCIPGSDHHKESDEMRKEVFLS